MKSKQVKVTVEPEIAKAFKDACIANGISITREISQFMAERADILNLTANKNNNRMNIRGGRRKETRKIIEQLEAIRDAEDDYKNKIPENLQSGAAYESAENTVESIEQAINALYEAFV